MFFLMFLWLLYFLHLTLESFSLVIALSRDDILCKLQPEVTLLHKPYALQSSNLATGCAETYIQTINTAFIMTRGLGHLTTLLIRKFSSAVHLKRRWNLKPVLWALNPVHAFTISLSRYIKILYSQLNLFPWGRRLKRCMYFSYLHSHCLSGTSDPPINGVTTEQCWLMCKRYKGLHCHFLHLSDTILPGRTCIFCYKY